MYKALDVARYVINYCNQNHIGISNLKLQKVLYFIQAEFLVSNSGEDACFNDRIEAWDFGPVVPSVYRHYKLYGSANIPATSAITYRDILPWDRDLIDGMIKKTAPYSAAELVQITHNQAPWKDAYIPGLNREITQKSIYDYFTE